MKRFLLASVAIIALLTGMASAALWVRTYWRTDRVQWSTNSSWQAVLGGHGRVLYIYAATVGNGPRFNVSWPEHDAKGPVTDVVTDQWLVPSPNQLLGFAFGTGSGNGYPYGYVVVVPLWFTTLVPLAVAVTWWRSFRRRHLAVATGCCRVCGYDLRATPDRCPECGHVPTPASVQPSS